jgi:biopolymer transport protein ExbD
MKIPHSSTLQRDLDVSMTPMIDVVFLLLIFFLCTASFQVAESSLPSPLAGQGAIAVLPPELQELELERLVVTVSEHQGQLALAINDQPCPTLERFSQLLAALGQIETDLPVLLDLADAIPLGTAIDVYDRCRLAGFERVQLVAEVP